MQNLFIEAENIRNELRHPYVGTEHFLLAFLKDKKYKNIDYDDLKKNVIEVIGSCYKTNEYILYTPILRKLKNNRLSSDRKKILEILSNTDSIAYNILLLKNYDIEKIYEEINCTRNS